MPKRSSTSWSVRRRVPRRSWMFFENYVREARAWPRRWNRQATRLERSTRRDKVRTRRTVRTRWGCAHRRPALRLLDELSPRPPTSGSPPSSSRSSARAPPDASGSTVSSRCRASTSSSATSLPPSTRQSSAPGNASARAVPRWRGVRRRPDLAGRQVRILQRVPNWADSPSPSFQEHGLAPPPDHNKKAVRGLVDLERADGRSRSDPLRGAHVERRTTSRGPRVRGTPGWAARGSTRWSRRCGGGRRPHRSRAPRQPP